VLPAGLTAAGLVNAQHPGGFRFAQQPSAWATKARCAVGHDTPCAIATSVTERAASPIAAPIWVRNRRVVRARAGTCGVRRITICLCGSLRG
jgi:hypothetical protein